MLIFPCHFASSKIVETFWHVGRLDQLRVIQDAHRRYAPGCELAIRIFEFCRKTGGVRGNKLRIDVFFLAQ